MIAAGDRSLRGHLASRGDCCHFLTPIRPRSATNRYGASGRTSVGIATPRDPEDPRFITGAGSDGPIIPGGVSPRD
jgi:hypothetical protein